jgi:hypothetical protein
VRAAAVLGVGLTAVAPTMVAGCGDSYSAVVDSLPIALTRAPMGGGMAGDGALLAIGASPDAPSAPYRMLVGTGASLTLLAGPPPVGTPATEKAGFDLLDAPGTIADPMTAVVRGQFRGVSVLRMPLYPVGDLTCADPTIPCTPGGVLGGDILRRYSVQMRFGAACGPGGTLRCSSMTIWPHLGPDLGFLQDSGYAVIRFALAGGGEVTADGDPDFLGQRGPLVVAPSRIVMRTCAAPIDFSPASAPTPIPACCKETDAEGKSMRSGIDLALVLDTGVGPLVLSATAWARVVAQLVERLGPTAAPVEAPGGQLLIATWPTPIPATWSTIPKIALVDLETGPATDPGPCVELARARRLEQVSYQVVQDDMNQVPTTACTQPCDSDPREPDKAQNSAAYLELTGSIPVAVIPDDSAYLQGLRFDLRPEEPEVDGVIGAGALGRSRVEIDYVSSPSRAVFSCESDAVREVCFAAARCPRLPDASFQHLCFGLRQHGFAPVCASGC